ncbi:MAG TPA: CocE/NonD family hydrolase [Dehalococcoidia bacterium]|nr:CocE/NonD family hydrolase [Dehalococcoidia bacterium]
MAYQTPTLKGVTDEQGSFRYREGESVAFAVGRLTLGIALGADRLTVADFAGALGDASPLTDPRVTNRARLLYSLSADPDLINGIVLTDRMVAAIDRAADRIDFDQGEAEFGADPAVNDVIAELGLRLRTAAEARNHLRRSRAGIKKKTDVKVPTRDGSYLLADVYRPIDGGRYPVVLRLSVYGKAFGNDCICNEDDRLRSEEREDLWFEDRPADLPASTYYAENIVSANTMDWVPRGYVLVRVDTRGVCQTPGVIDPFSRQEAEDYYDAIEWAAAQPWSDGNVGLLGASYAATIQWSVAALAPPSLRAMIPWAGDADSYRDLAYPGGIFHEGYRRWWWSVNVLGHQCRAEAVDFLGGLMSHPFDDPAFYGPIGSGPLSADFARITVPFLTAVSQTGVLHARAGFEAFTQSPAPHKQLVVVDANYRPFLYQECLDLQFAFFDRFLKGIDVQPRPPVRMILRTGNGQYDWRDETAWPVPGTEYRALYLDATAGPTIPWEVSGVAAQVPGGTSLRLAAAAPTTTGQAAYSAEVAPETPCWQPGVSFLSEPLSDDLVLAGHFTARLWVSSTASDLDVYVAIRVIVPDGAEVPYPVHDPGSRAPLTWGNLKVSQRATEPARSTADRPWHTHREADRAPLTSPDEIVEVEVELMPATALVRAGHRLRVDVQPVEGCGAWVAPGGIPTRRAYDPSYHTGAENRVHTGGVYPSHIRLPVLPPRD